MRQLQSSLLASRNGVLALDLAAIGQGTREQVELSLQLGKISALQQPRRRESVG